MEDGSSPSEHEDEDDADADGHAEAEAKSKADAHVDMSATEAEATETTIRLDSRERPLSQCTAKRHAPLPPPPKPKAAKAQGPQPKGGKGRAGAHGGGPLSQLMELGVIRPGEGVLTVQWNGVELRPRCNLTPSGYITVDGVGRPRALHFPSGILQLLAKNTSHGRRALPNFEKGNGWAAVHYQGRPLLELREAAGVSAERRGAAAGPRAARGAYNSVYRVGADSESDEDMGEGGDEQQEDMSDQESEEEEGSAASSGDDFADGPSARTVSRRRQAPRPDDERREAERRRLRGVPASAPAHTVPRRAGREAGMIEGCPSGAVFRTLQALHESGVHLGQKGGLCGNETIGALSLLLTDLFDADLYSEASATSRLRPAPHATRRVARHAHVAFSCVVCDTRRASPSLSERAPLTRPLANRSSSPVHPLPLPARLPPEGPLVCPRVRRGVRRAWR